MLNMQKQKKLRAKLITIWKEHKWFIIGLTGVVLTFIGGAGLRTTTIPWLVSADAPFHLDYAWQVYQGNLPVAVEGIQMPINKAFHPTHLAVQHPPLYYTILAPFVGPFLANGEWQIATFMGRLLSLGSGLLSTLALSWMAWVIGGRYKYVLAIAAPAIAITFVPFLGHTSAVYNDVLVVLMTIVALTLSILTIRNGPSALYIVCLTLVSLLGMASRVSFFSVLGLVLISLVLSFIIHGKNTRTKEILKGIKYATVVAIVVLIGTGWFYYFHNFKVSGSFISAWPDSVQQTVSPGRNYKPLVQVVTSSNLWSLVPLRLFGRSLINIGGHTLNYWISLTVFGLGVAGSIAWLIKEKAWRMLDKTHKIPLIIAGILIAHFGLIFAQQIVYATGYGAYNPRYLLPAWFVIGLALSFGFSAWRRLRGVGVVFAATVGWVAIINWTLYTLTGRTNISTEKGWLYLLQTGAEQNGFPGVIVPILLIAIMTGVILIGFALWNLTKQENIPSVTGFSNEQTDTAKTE